MNIDYEKMVIMLIKYAEEKKVKGINIVYDSENKNYLLITDGKPIYSGSFENIACRIDIISFCEN